MFNKLRQLFSPNSRFVIALAIKFFSGSGKTRKKLYEKLAGLMEHGVTQQRAVVNLKKRALKRGATDFEAIVLGQIEMRLREGKAAGRTFEPYVPINEGVVLQSYDSNFIQGLRDCAKSIEDNQKIKSCIVSATAAPGFYLALLLVVMYIYGNVVIPKIAYALPMEHWTGLLKGLAWLSLFVSSSWFWVFIGGIVFAVLLFFWALPRFTGPVRAFLDKYPPFSLYRILIGARTLQAIASLMSSGLAVPQAVEKLKILSERFPWLFERLESTHFYLRDGKQLGEAFELTKLHFPDQELIEDLIVFATLDKFDKKLIEIATNWTEESIKQVSTTSKVLNNVLLIFVGSFIAFMTMGIMGIGAKIQEFVNAAQIM